MKKLSLVVWGLSLLSVAGCGRSQHQQNADVIAPAKITEAFSVVETRAVPSAATVNDKFQVTISTDALEKEFLLQAAVIQNGDAPSFSGFKSRVVAFRKRGEKLYLLETQDGHNISKDLPMTLLLAEFPIISENASEKKITFDFNAGMSALFVGRDWHAPDLMGANHKLADKAVKLRFSYIDSAKLDQSRQQLVIDQYAQVNGEAGAYATVQVKYYLSPYQPAADYVAVKSKGFGLVGFFTAQPQITNDGSHVAYATKFHQAKPITFAVSANTPAQYKQAVKDGVLYWNKVFGEEKIKVVDAPAGVSAPDLNYNIVQWVDNDTAGGAYADAQLDPRTGEILHAQIYMTSTFAVSALERSYIFEQRNKQQKVALAGFEDGRLCEHEMAAPTIPANVSKETALKVAQDYVRDVVAHEVGHTLGLRHNFAGSLATNFALSQRKEIFDFYLKNGVAPKGVVTSSSVMDYIMFEESVIQGDRMARGELALEYDVKALEMLYKGKQYSLSEMPAFCTDSHTEAYADCRRFDSGASPVEYAAWDLDQAFQTLPHRLLEAYVRAVKSPRRGVDPVSVDKVGFSPDQYAGAMLASREGLYKSLTSKLALLKIRRTFPYIGPVNLEEVRQAEVGFVAAEFSRLGGIDKLFGAVPVNYGAKAFEEFALLLNTGHFSSGIAPNGERYEFSPAEIATIKAMGRKFFDKMGAALAKQDVATVKTAGKLADVELGYSLASVHEARLLQYVLATEEGKDQLAEVVIANPKKGEKGEPATLKVTLALPKFVYPLEVRTAAAALLSAANSEAPDWALVERARAKKTVQALLTKALGGQGFDKFKVEELPRPVARWILENKKVSDAL